MSDFGDDLKNNLKNSTADAGDLTFLKEGSLNDLSWLEVDEAAYRDLDSLPKQNLDVVPDLEAMWAHDDQPATAYFDKDRPHTMGDLSDVHGPLRSRPEDVMRTARLAIMQSSDPGRLKSTLVTRFDPESLRGSREVLAGVLAERGLLGRFYIDSSDFPGCHTSPKTAKEFVRRHAGEARYVKAKDRCANCIHAMQTPTGGVNCAVFHKELVVDVPYTDEIATKVEEMQAAKGREVQASTSPPKERIRLAMLAPAGSYDKPTASPKPVVDPGQFMKPTMAPEQVVAKVDLTKPKAMARDAVAKALREGRLTVTEAQDGYKRIAAAQQPSDLGWIVTTAQTIETPERSVYVGAGEQLPLAVVPEAQVQQQIINAGNLLRKRDEAARQVLAARKAAPVITLLRREMLKGRGASELAHSLKLAFQSTDLQETRALWEPVFREAGLYGSVYTTQDSFDDCREGADFVAKHNPGIRAVTAGSKCEGCIYNKIGRCLMYGKPLVKNAYEVVTWDMAGQMLQEHKASGRIASTAPQAKEWGKDPRDALKSMHNASALKGGATVSAAFRNDVFTAFRGTGPTQTTSGMTRRDVVKTAARYLNEGLYGDDLLRALKASFDVRDILAAKDDLRSVVAEQGLQGIYYVDPTIYDDYGKGCNEASRLFRAKGVPYIKLGDKCGSCVHHIQSGQCSVINKPLVIEPPYGDKLATQRAILASGNATETSFAELQNNGMTMIAEYQMQNGGMDIDLNPEPERVAVEVQFSTGKMKL